MDITLIFTQFLAFVYSRDIFTKAAPLRLAASKPIAESSKIMVSSGVTPSIDIAFRKQSGAGLGLSISSPDRMPSMPESNFKYRITLDMLSM
jgi:hypothetical protein